MSLVAKAFATLMGMSGDRYVQEIETTNMLSPESYAKILDNISYNDEESVVLLGGVVLHYYLQGIRRARRTPVVPN